MASPVADSLRARAHAPPSGTQLNALDLALEQILRSNVSTTALNETSSTVLRSIRSSVIDLQNVPASASASAASEPLSASSSLPSDVSLSSVASQSASAAPASAVSPTGSEGSSSASARETELSPSGSASPSDGALSVTKNAAISSSASLADSSPVPMPAPSSTTSSQGTKESPTFKTNPASSPSGSSTSASEPDATLAPEPSSSSSESSTKAAPASSQAPSTTTNAATTQQVTQPSTLAPASSNNEVSFPTTSNGAEAPNTDAASPHPGNTSISSANQEGQENSPINASLRAGQPSPTGSIPNSATDLGNSFIGIISPSHVDSTLSTPGVLTITSGSQTFVTTPAFITSISVGTGSNGLPIATFTSVFANPTFAPGVGGLAGDRLFGDNKGAVAGVFATVALVLLSTIFGAIFCCRRRRRRIAHGFDDAQFRRFSSPPEMLQHPTTYQPVRGRGSAADDPTRYLTVPNSTSEHVNGQEHSGAFQCSGSQGLGLTGIPPRPPGLTPPDYEGPFSDYHRYISTGDTRLGTPPGGPIGIAVTNDFEGKAEPVREEKGEGREKTEHRSPSPAPSSPSIYPPPLPTVREKDEDDYLFYEQETKRRPESQSQLATPPPKAKAIVKNDSDRQNPFSSPLDPVHDGSLSRRTSEPGRLMTNSSYRPLTPPDSSAGHSPTNPQFTGANKSSTKPLNVSRYSNAFLGRSVSTRTEGLRRPPRNPLRMSTSGSSLPNYEEP